MSFGIRGDQLIPSEVTRIIGIEPSKAWKKGETYQSRFRKEDASIGIQKASRPWGIWEISSKGNVLSDNIEDHAGDGIYKCYLEYYF